MFLRHIIPIQTYMTLSLTLTLVLAVCAYSDPSAVTLSSAHTFNAFQLTMSIAPGQIIGIFSKKIVEEPSHWVNINTHGDRAVLEPALDPKRILLNDQHEGRHLIEYYELTHSTHLRRHFHYVEVET